MLWLPLNILLSTISSYPDADQLIRSIKHAIVWLNLSGRVFFLFNAFYADIIACDMPLVISGY